MINMASGILLVTLRFTFVHESYPKRLLFPGVAFTNTSKVSRLLGKLE